MTDCGGGAIPGVFKTIPQHTDRAGGAERKSYLAKATPPSCEVPRVFTHGKTSLTCSYPDSWLHTALMLALTSSHPSQLTPIAPRLVMSSVDILFPQSVHTILL